MSGPPLLLLHLSQNFQVRVKDVRNIHSRCGYIKTLENFYIPDFKVLYSKSSTFATSTCQNLHVGVKDVQKNIFYLECTICQVLHFYYFILAKNFKLGWKMYQIWASMIIYQLNRGKIRNSVIGPNCNWGCLCFFLIGQ